MISDYSRRTPVLWNAQLIFYEKIYKPTELTQSSLTLEPKTPHSVASSKLDFLQNSQNPSL